MGPFQKGVYSSQTSIGGNGLREARRTSSPDSLVPINHKGERELMHLSLVKTINLHSAVTEKTTTSQFSHVNVRRSELTSYSKAKMLFSPLVSLSTRHKYSVALHACIYGPE